MSIHDAMAKDETCF